MKTKNKIGIRLLIIIVAISILFPGCKKENDLVIDPITFNPSITYGSLTDQDGNTYKTVAIGTQIWMAENLKTIKYNDGTGIPLVTDYNAWSNLATPGYCWYDNNEKNYKKTYGALYNWYTTNTAKLCPAGWHVPTYAEWITLETYLINNGFNYDGTIAGNKIAKSIASAVLWELSITPGAVGNADYPAKRNATGFTALPGGVRGGSEGIYYDNDIFRLHGCWWSATEGSDTTAWQWFIRSNNPELHYFMMHKRFGSSVRCIKN